MLRETSVLSRRLAGRGGRALVTLIIEGEDEDTKKSDDKSAIESEVGGEKDCLQGLYL